MFGIEWVLDWNRIANLLVVLLPFFVMVGGGFKYLLDRSDKKAEQLRKEAQERRDADEEDRDRRRKDEMEEMRAARDVFYKDILQEASRMRELYEAELDRGITLRTALAEAARREMELMAEVRAMTKKIDALQQEVVDLRKQIQEGKMK